MCPDGSYERAPKTSPSLSAQQYLMELSRSPEKQLGRTKPAIIESTPDEEAESILSKEQSGL
jgi:hypothetical protein